ncbi:MAG: hypothetical protein ABI304_14970 [Rudaea sp.]
MYITDRGRPANVLLRIEAYEKLASNQASIVEMLVIPRAEAARFDPPRLRDNMRRAVDRR